MDAIWPNESPEAIAVVAVHVTRRLWLNMPSFFIRPHSHLNKKGNICQKGDYRIGKLIIMAIFVFGALGIGNKIAGSIRQIAENGRYIQYDRKKYVVTTGNSTRGYPAEVIETRTEAVQSSDHH
jgi:hypothetical protein